MSDNTINKALRVMGYDTRKEICGHGFRAMACSALSESGLWSKEAIEKQMSHQERNIVRAAYIHKAEYLEERINMMQWWADYLDINTERYVALSVCRSREGSVIAQTSSQSGMFVDFLVIAGY